MTRKEQKEIRRQQIIQVAFMVGIDTFDEEGTIFFDCAPFETGGRTVDRISVKGYAYEPQFAPEGKTVLQVNVPQFDREYAYWKGLTRRSMRVRKRRQPGRLKSGC